jgi:hypothetical protein
MPRIHQFTIIKEHQNHSDVRHVLLNVVFQLRGVWTIGGKDELTL